jgi:hypothetical protein
MLKYTSLCIRRRIFSILVMYILFIPIDNCFEIKSMLIKFFYINFILLFIIFSRYISIKYKREICRYKREIFKKILTIF